MRSLSLCTRCQAAMVAGDPSCDCPAEFVIAVSWFDRQATWAWFTYRMWRRRRELARAEGMIDRDYAYAALERRAGKRGGTFVRLTAA